MAYISTVQISIEETECDDEVQTITVEKADEATSTLSKPPKPPPLPPVPLRVHNESACYFNDGIRKIDFILVYRKETIEDVEGNDKIRNFVLVLEEFGLEMEGEDSMVDEGITFVKIHGGETILRHYAIMCNVNLVFNSPYYFPFKPPYLRCMRNDANAPDYYSDVFERAPEIFSGERPTKMSDSERIMVISQLMRLVQYGPEKDQRGLQRLLREGIFMDAYPVHDGYYDWTEEGRLCERQILRKYWSRTSQCLKAQPLHIIQRYFGSHITFYFAWMEFFTKMLAPLALLSLICFISGLINMGVNSQEICSDEKDIDLCPPCEHYAYCSFRKLNDFCLNKKLSYILDNSLSLILAIFTSIWSHVLIIFWKRRERKLAYMWDLDRMVISDIQRTEYIEKANVIKVSSATGLPEKYISDRTKYSRIALTYVTCIFFTIIILVSISGVGILRLMAQMYINKRKMSNNAQLIAACLGTAASIGIILFFGALNLPLMIKLNKMEIPRTQWEFDNSLVYKTFLMEFINTFAPVFYLAFFKGRLFKHPGQTHHIDIIAKLQWDRCGVAGCGLDLAIQLLFTMIVINMRRNLLALIFPVWSIYSKKRKYKIESLKHLPRWEQDWFLNRIGYYQTHKELMESTIQYGFVTFFVSVFPLAPLLAFINNVFELRLDAYKLTNNYRRAVPKQVPGLGAWLDILRMLTHLGTITNAFVIAFTGEFISRIIYELQVDYTLNGYTYSTLSKFSVADYPDLGESVPKPPISICYYTAKRYPPDHPKKYELTTEFWYEISMKFIFALLFEHVMLLINYVLQLLIYPVPGCVRRKQKLENQKLRETRLRVLNDAYKDSHGEFAISKSKRLILPKIDILRARDARRI